MTKRTSILTDIELGAVAGGSMITDMAVAGIQRGARRWVTIPWTVTAVTQHAGNANQDGLATA